MIIRIFSLVLAFSLFPIAHGDSHPPEDAEYPSASVTAIPVVDTNSRAVTPALEALPLHLENAVRAGDRASLPPNIGASAFNGVVPISKIWSGQSYPLKVCFFGGYDQLRQRIAKAAKAWENESNGIKLDFGKDAVPRTCSSNDINHIRISFSYRGYWSTVGNDSVNRAYQSQSSMNYGGWDTWALPPNDELLNSTVAHEFGHALGFEHEHQHPLSKCEAQFDWDKIYEALSRPPNQWDKSKVDHNMRKLASRGRLFPQEIDLTSIMLYQFPSNFYKMGSASECYQSTKNTSISAKDYKLAAKIYPPTERGMIKAQQERREKVLAILSNEFQDQEELSRVLARFDAASNIPRFSPTTAFVVREFEMYSLGDRIAVAQ